MIPYKKHIPLLFLLFITLSTYSQEAAPVDFGKFITPERLRQHLEVIASDSMEGRETGERGQKMAADYIARHFAETGLAPVVPGDTGKSYFQHFTLKKQAWGQVALKAGDEEKTFLEDFYAYGDFRSDGWDTMEIVFAGYGIDHPSYSDYDRIDVTDKAVIMLLDEPVDTEGLSLITGTEKVSHWNRNWELKVKTARKHGARMVFFIAGDRRAFAKRLAWLKSYIAAPSMSFPGTEKEKPFSFFIPENLAIDLLQINEKKYQKRLQKTSKKGKSPAFSKRKNPPVSFIVERTEEEFVTENVLGYLEGTDKKEEVIVITAHYDHLGIDGDKIYNGADDDGSGTVSVMEIARAFALAREHGQTPRRSLLFMTVTGEEKGLLGSEYYTDNPLFPLEDHVANLNIDMIGRIDEENEATGDSNYVYLIGADRLSQDLHELNEAANEKHTQLRLDYTYNDPNDPNRFYYRSDHYNFAKNNIPVIFYFTGVHEDYHQPTDTHDKIMYHKMSTIAQLIFYTAWELANREERIRLNEGIEHE